MYTCQCKGCQMGQSRGVLLKEVAAFQRCPIVEVHCIISLYYGSFVFLGAATGSPYFVFIWTSGV